MAQTILYTLLALLGGIFMAVQAPTNAIIGRASGSTLLAALISFVVGTIALAVLWGLSGAPRHIVDARGLPWYAWIGGLYGAFFVAAAALIAPRIGVGSMLTAVVAGQLAAALVVDHYGLIQLPMRPVTITRIAGAGLVFVGALLVRRG